MTLEETERETKHAEDVLRMGDSMYDTGVYAARTGRDLGRDTLDWTVRHEATRRP